ncbi:MAG: recombination regulator RecX [Sulfuricellaceae bacterium]
MPEPDLRSRALACLARREHTRIELERKLASYCEDRDEIAALLDDFTQRGWLNEARYAEMLVQARQGKFGSRRIIHELREKGVSEETIAAALPEVQENELETARATWAKKFGAVPADAREKARQMRFLAGRGFGQEVIFKVLKGLDQL